MNELSAPLGRVIEQVAAFEQISPEDLPAVAESVSPETFTRLTTEWTEQTAPIEFSYVWYGVTITPAGEVTIRP